PLAQSQAFSTPQSCPTKRAILDRGVATVNRPVIDRGLFPSAKTHGQENADRGYELDPHNRSNRPQSEKLCSRSLQRTLRRPGPPSRLCNSLIRQEKNCVPRFPRVPIVSFGGAILGVGSGVAMASACWRRVIFG